MAGPGLATPRHYWTGRRKGSRRPVQPTPVTENQAALDLYPPPPVELGPLEAAFEEFHTAHPEVYGQLKSLAIAAVVRRGRRRLSINQLFEVVRWNLETMGGDEAGFKLNNNHRAFYARRLMADVPTLEGVFATRQRRSR